MTPLHRRQQLEAHRRHRIAQSLRGTGPVVDLDNPANPSSPLYHSDYGGMPVEEAEVTEAPDRHDEDGG